MSVNHPSSVPSSARRYRAVTGNILLVFVSAVLGLAIIEGLLVFFVPAPIVWLRPQEFYYPDPKVGHRLVPNQHSYTHSFPVVTNSNGLRDREFPQAPISGVVRILCLGDSLTFGDGVAVEDTYPKQLERLLNQERKNKFEVINAGVPSYDTWQEVAYFEEWGIRLKPSIVIIGFYANDIVPKPERVKGFLTEKGTLRRQGIGGMLPDVVVHTLKGSRLLLLLRDRLGKLYNQISPSMEVLQQQALLQGTENDFVDRGWKEVDASLQKLSALTKKNDYEVLLVIFPMAEQLIRDYPRAQYQSRLRTIADKYHIAQIDLMESFKREFTDYGSLFIEWDGHPNARAHGIAAREIARYLESSRSPDRSVRVLGKESVQ